MPVKAGWGQKKKKENSFRSRSSLSSVICIIPLFAFVSISLEPDMQQAFQPFPFLPFFAFMLGYCGQPYVRTIPPLMIAMLYDENIKKGGREGKKKKKKKRWYFESWKGLRRHTKKRKVLLELLICIYYYIVHTYLTVLNTDMHIRYTGILYIASYISI